MRGSKRRKTISAPPAQTVTTTQVVDTETTSTNTDGGLTTTNTSGTEKKTETTAYLDGSGAFSSAWQTQSTTSYGGTIGPTVTSKPTQIGYGDARKVIGGTVLDAASAHVIDTSRGSYFARELVKDHHTVVQGGTAIAGGVCILAEPCGAVATVGAFVVGAIDFAAEKFKLW